MWVLKFSLYDEKGIFSWRNKKFKVRTYAHRTGFYTKGSRTFVNAILLLEGKDEDKKEFIKSLKEENHIRNLEVNGNLLSCLISKPLSLSKERKEEVFYNLETVHLKPVFTNEKGIEFWEVGSWDRKPLQKILKQAEKLYNGEMSSFIELKISESDFLFFSLYPKLTQKQREAFFSALHTGYYEFPRKIELKGLAKLMKVSYTTYQFHLRNAEKKIMNSVGLKI